MTDARGFCTYCAELLVGRHCPQCGRCQACGEVSVWARGWPRCACPDPLAMTGGHYDEEGEPVLAEEAHEAAHRALDDEKRETEKRREITIEEAMDWRNQV